MKVGDLMPLISAFTFNISSILNVGRTIIDLILVWYVIYLLISMMKQNMRTMQLFKGVLLILILKMFTSLLRLSAIIIVFQPEIRGLLEKIGRTKLELKHDNLSDDEKERLMDELVGAITKLSEDQTGALITFERRQSLIDYINTGTKINADIKAELFTTIFWEGTPLHDGATIIKGDRVVCAAAFYPPTNQELSPLYGARHRAALGISEITDSLTVVVSEETGTISFATDGKLRKIPRKELRASLVNELDWFNTQEKDGE